MKVRDSGMPPEEMWEEFFNPELILSKLKLDNKINDAAEFGSGYGTFSIPASKIIKRKLYAFDIDDFMIAALNKKILKRKITNIEVIKRDFISDGTGLNRKSVDYVMLFNILHAENPILLLNEAYRILKKDGKVGIIHWIYSEETPRGPSLDIRPKAEQCLNWLKLSGFETESVPFDLPPYHYGIIGNKK